MFIVEEISKYISSIESKMGRDPDSHRAFLCPEE
jgi:hypothetical protein